jgi:hypothetical protein
MATKKKSRRFTKVPLVIAAVAASAALVYAAATIYGPGPSSLASARASAAPVKTGAAAARLRVTLDPNLFTGEAHRAYEVAAHHPALLAQLHCYCGCERDGTMHNLLDCYRTTHGSECPTCMGEALEAARLARQGVPIEEIRNKLSARWGGGE